jgi:adenylate cyclase
MKVLSLRVPVAIARVEQTLEICAWLCDRLNMDDSMKRTLSLAGRLKEIGKISLADDLLHKPPSRYSVQEREQCETFPVLGQLLLADIPQLKDVATLIRHQNENYDGTGYPDRLTETRIPLGSRILRAINEAQKLMEEHPALPDLVRETLMDSIGTRLDPKIGLLVEEYVRVVADPSWTDGKRRVALEELQEGMVIAGDLITGRGMMLLSKDSALTHSQIERLASLSHFDPIIQEIYIYEAAA